MKTNSGFIILFLFCLNLSAQTLQNEYSILFYNVENLFDARNDSLNHDDEFTPEGDRHWTYRRLEKKITNITRVIAGSSGWDAPTLIALCEIENGYILDRLRQSTHLRGKPYKVIHKDSPDHRGIDVGLLYNSAKFHPIEYDYYPLIDKNGEVRKSREILYVSGVIEGKDTLHLFVNHWPSRYSGVLETKESRNGAAKLLKGKVLQLQKLNNKAKIVIVGDFNDSPVNESIRTYLGVLDPVNTYESHKLYNLSMKWEKQKYGTLKYRSQWFVFDQIIVSGALLKAKTHLHTKTDWASIYQPPFLLEKDQVYGGSKPFRTYSGYKYIGGFSDHLPILLKLQNY